MSPRRQRWFGPAPGALRIARNGETRMDQIQAIVAAINGYFDLMYDADDNQYPAVFHDACVVHGMREGKLNAWSRLNSAT